MSQGQALEHKFVQCIPDVLDDRVIYVSIEYGTVVHRCCCGCGEEVVTPLSPTDWKLIYDGKTVSLTPSIGNWNFKCQAHYWIIEDRVMWARKLSARRIQQIRDSDRLAKNEYYSGEYKQGMGRLYLPYMDQDGGGSDDPGDADGD